MYNHGCVNVKCEQRNSNRTQQHKCVWSSLPWNPSQNWRNILYSLVENKHRWRKPITRGKSPSRRWNKFCMLTTSSLLEEAAYAAGMAVAFSPGNCLVVKCCSRKGKCVTQQRCRKLVNVTKKYKIFLCVILVADAWRWVECRKTVPVPLSSQYCDWQKEVAQINLA